MEPRGHSVGEARKPVAEGAGGILESLVQLDEAMTEQVRRAKERMLDDVERRYPARRYVMVDDKVRILAAMKAIWQQRLTTVFVKQGHYAHDTSPLAMREADHVIDAIGDMSDLARPVKTSSSRPGGSSAPSPVPGLSGS
jgi:hypothetical protein